jgi:NDP-sugar pyrophosphorylase family protein
MDNINNYTDEDLKQLMEKYKEKQQRYNLIYNEQTIRNERIILNIHLEQIRRFREKHIQAYRDAKLEL